MFATQIHTIKYIFTDFIYTGMYISTGFWRKHQYHMFLGLENTATTTCSFGRPVEEVKFDTSLGFYFQENKD